MSWLVTLAALLLAPVLVVSTPNTAEALVPPPTIPVAVADALTGADGLTGTVGLLCSTGVGCAAAGSLALAGGLWLTRDYWLPWVKQLFNDPGSGTGSGSRDSGVCLPGATLSFAQVPTGTDQGTSTINVQYPERCNASYGQTWPAMSIRADWVCTNTTTGATLQHSNPTWSQHQASAGDVGYQFNGPGCVYPEDDSAGTKTLTAESFHPQLVEPNNYPYRPTGGNDLGWNSGYTPAQTTLTTTVDCLSPDGVTHSTITASSVGTRGLPVPSCAAALGSGWHGVGVKSVQCQTGTQQCVTILDLSFNNPGDAGQRTDVNGWTYCADDGGNCAFTGTHTVAFGLNGKYLTKVATNGLACAGPTFVGPDPAPGYTKKCYYGPPPYSSCYATPCALHMYYQGVQCSVNVPQCVDWTSQTAAHPADYACHYGPYTVALTYCSVLEYAYGYSPMPITDPAYSDGDPSTGSPRPSATPTATATAQPTPTGTGNPAPTGSVGPSSTPTSGGFPTTGTNPSTGDGPASDNCISGAWSWNPVNWVYVPVKCVMLWAFEPSDATKTAVENAGSISGKAPFAQIGSISGQLSSLASPGSTCWAIGVDMPSPIGHVDALDSCKPDPVTGKLQLFRPLIAVALYVSVLGPLAWWAWRTYAPGSTGNA